MCISPSILPSIQQLCPPPSKAIKTVISLSHSRAFHISFRERPESSPYLHGYYTVCMRVKTMGSAWWDHGTSFLRGHSGRHKDNLPAARRTGTAEGCRRISRSLSSGLWGGSSPVIREGKKRRKDVTAAVVKGLWRLLRKPRSVTGTQTWSLYSCLCTEAPQRIEQCCCSMSTVLQPRQSGQCLAETRGEKEVLDWRGCGRVKWQALGGRGRGLRQETSSQVTKTAGLGFKVSSLSFSWLQSAHCFSSLSEIQRSFFFSIRVLHQGDCKSWFNHFIPSPSAQL